VSTIINNPQPGQRWICCQIGAREHYSIPRALLRRGVLDELITDVWTTPGSLMSLGNGAVRNRFHDSLTNTKVRAANVRSIMFELRSRVRRHDDGWKLITERNDWFQRFAVSQLRRRADLREPVTVFAYSYAARLIFKFARQRGWRTILGQIDAGPVGERIGKRLASNEASDADDLRPALPDYWDEWRSEVELADCIVVNSNWSQDALIADGVAPEKIKVIPLAFEKPEAANGFERNYPDKFTPERPLRVLFLGQVNRRKGSGALFDAIRILKDKSMEFWFVGPIQVTIPTDLKDDSRVKWFQSVPRDRVGQYYRDADVFVFPTLSDGFGLTQLEAQSWKLPLIASRNCAPVVKNGVTGLMLEEVSGPAIVEALLSLHRSPQMLHRMSAHSDVGDEFGLNSLASSLVNL
jgi:glycosyltransferase involved in cell wall biosynthesis